MALYDLVGSHGGLKQRRYPLIYVEELNSQWEVPDQEKPLYHLKEEGIILRLIVITKLSCKIQH